METVKEIRPDFGMFMKTLPQEDYLLTFYDFIKVFLHGDVYALMRTSPFAASSSPVEHLDPEFQFDDELRMKYFGDPVKRAMFVQALRRWPYMTAIPVIFSLAIFIASLLKLTVPFITRFSVLLENLLVPESREEDGGEDRRRKRRKRGEVERESVTIDRIWMIPGRLQDYCVTLAKAVESIEFLVFNYMDKEDGFRLDTTRKSTLFANLNEDIAKQNVRQAMEIGKSTQSWLQSWSQLFPTLKQCVDQIFSCHLKFRPSSGSDKNCSVAGGRSECATFLGAFLTPIVKHD
eukprot:TRINITY_DN5863_c0_g1_i7.p1 TRINITY_DN5863_c0_g1~~TRINITY_DN5863_c0_g1_i7.p1  ORF type:complete len:291 (+),score=46.13 TRINITY_DN5863_c0_g1_i7:37-909(+)